MIDPTNCAAAHLGQVADGGYREFVAGGIRRPAERLDVALDASDRATS